MLAQILSHLQKLEENENCVNEEQYYYQYNNEQRTIIYNCRVRCIKAIINIASLN